MIWFTSDLHLGHASIIRHGYRPYSTVRHMNDRLVGSINDRVSWTDDLWILGDFSHGISADEVARYRERINCRNVYLVRGNHDLHFPEGASPFSQELDYYEGLRTSGLERRRIVMCHYPIADWNGLNGGAIHLHGHIHAKMSYNERNRERGLLRYDVGVDANGYAPVSLASIETFFAGVEPAAVHHQDVL